MLQRKKNLANCTFAIASTMIAVAVFLRQPTMVVGAIKNNIMEHPGQGNVPDHVLDKFKSSHGVKAGYKLKLKEIDTTTNTIELPDGETVSLHNLQSESMLTPSATCTFDGKAIPCPTNSAIFSKEQNGIKILVKKNPNGKITSISSRKLDDGTHTIRTLQAVADDVFAEIPAEAMDQDYLSQFSLEDEDVATRLRRSLLRGIQTDHDEQEEQHSSSSITVNVREDDYGFVEEEGEAAATATAAVTGSGNNARHLQGECSSLRVIEVAIAADSSFCADAGGEAGAWALVQQVIADVSFDYEQFNPFLCFTARISHYEAVSAIILDSFLSTSLLGNYIPRSKH